MYKHFLTLIVASLLSWSMAAQCPTGSTILDSQADVDNFIATYPTCTTIDGFFIIGVQGGAGDSDITDISGLSNLTTINGNIRIEGNPGLSDLNGLQGLTSVSNLTLVNNDGLTSFSELSNITSVSGNLEVRGHASITSLNGLGGFSSIPGGMFITENASLTDLSALSTVTSVTGSLNFSDNPMVSDISGLANISSTGVSALFLENNTSLSTCEVASVCSIIDDGTASLFIGNNAAGCSSEMEIEAACAGPPCPMGSVVLATQEDVDSFIINYPTCTTIDGDLTVGIEGGSSDIADLSGLANITTINGGCYFYGTQLTSFSGLSGITTVNGACVIQGNFSLSTLDGLGTGPGIQITDLRITSNAILTSIQVFSGLTTVNGDLVISDNPLLPDFTGLNQLTTVNGSCLFYNNTSLSSFSALSNVTTVGGTLEVGGNLSLTTLTGLEGGIGTNITDFTLTGNTALTDITALIGLTSISGNLTIGGNSSLSSFSGLDNLTNIGGGCEFYGNANIDFTGLGGVTSVNGVCLIYDNPNLTSLTGLGTGPGINITDLRITGNSALTDITIFTGLTTIAGEFEFGNNGSATSLDGLDDVTTIGGACLIYGNSALTSIDGLTNVTSAGGEVRIENNPNLANCAIESVCNAIDGGAMVTISGNATGCESVTDVEIACGLVGGGASAMNFDGINDYLEVPGGLTTQITGEISVQAWFRVNNFVSGSSIVHNLEWTQNGNLFSGYAISILGSDGVEGIISTADNDLVRVQYNGLSANVWYHVTMTYNGSLVRLYIDGEEVAINGATGSIDYSPAPQGFFIGRYNDSNEDVYFDGDIDEVRIWDRALGCVEIPQQYACELSGSEPNLVAYYQFNQGVAEGNNTSITEVTATTGFDCIINNMDLMGPTSNFIAEGGVATGVICGPVMNPSFSLSTNGSPVNPNTVLGGFVPTEVGQSQILATIDVDAFLTEWSTPTIDNPNFSIVELNNAFNIIFTPTMAGQETGMITIGLEDCLGISVFGFSVVANATMPPGGDCPPEGSYTAVNQDDVDDFLAMYPNCTELTGFLRIGTKTAAGATNITDLSAFSNLTAVQGRVTVYNNPGLNNLDGLDNIVTMGSNFGVWNNGILTFANVSDGISGFALQSIAGDFNVNNNGTLDGFFGLGNLTSIGGRFNVRSNNALRDFFGLDNLASIGGFFGIGQNASLNSLAGTSGLQTIGGRLDIRENVSLETIRNIENDGGDGMISLTSIGSGLYIDSNISLETLDGFDVLADIGSNMAIIGNSALTDLTALSSVTTMNGNIVIRKNETIETLNGLENLDPNGINSLYIVANPQLSICNVESVCTYLSDMGAFAAIDGNDKNCANRAEVETECDDMFADNDNGVAGYMSEGNGIDQSNTNRSFDGEFGQLEVFPNPTSSILQIRNIEALSVTVMTAAGQQVAYFANPGQEVDLRQVPAGVYYLTFETANGRLTERVVKL